jgi:hypothetical protein
MNLKCKNCPSNGIDEFACETCMMEYSYNNKDIYENNEYIKDAIFESVWDDGVVVKSKCKVNIFTRQVTDIEQSNIEGLDILQFEYIWINEECYAVYAEDDERLLKPSDLKPVFYY